MMTDPVADMLTRIRNATAAGHATVVLPYSKLKFTLANILMREGYLSSVERAPKGSSELLLGLRRSPEGAARITGIERVSKPGRRVYVGWSEIPRVRSNQGVSIISTSAGIMTGGEAKVRRLGGEVICKVY